MNDKDLSVLAGIQAAVRKFQSLLADTSCELVHCAQTAVESQATIYNDNAAAVILRVEEKRLLPPDKLHLLQGIAQNACVARNLLVAKTRTLLQERAEWFKLVIGGVPLAEIPTEEVAAESIAKGAIEEMAVISARAGSEASTFLPESFLVGIWNERLPIIEEAGRKYVAEMEARMLRSKSRFDEFSEKLKDLDVPALGEVEAVMSKWKAQLEITLEAFKVIVGSGA